MTAPARDERGRECTVCPSYTTRCTHFDGELLFLSDRAGLLNLPRFLGGKWHRPDDPHSAVSYFYEGDDLAAAEAAFLDAETRLLNAP